MAATKIHDGLITPWTVFLIFLRLGLTSFGGPVAHLSYFHQEFVVQRRWLSERSYADMVALCQFLPGPVSSQVGIALGLIKAGYSGALSAWIGFTLPSAMALILFALGISTYADSMPIALLHGLKVAAVAVVAQAVWGMAKTQCTDTTRITMMVIATIATLLAPAMWGPVAVIVLAAIIGLWLFKPSADSAPDALRVSISRSSAVLCLAVFGLLLAGLPILAQVLHNPMIEVVDAFFRVGSFVFGGGHVMLPLLQAEVVPTGWVSNDAFMAGYGATQAVPGPLFTFAAFLGASMSPGAQGWLSGLICLLAIFLPSFLLVVGVMPFWEHLRHLQRIRAALTGINVAVVGILLAALYQPVWTSAIHGPQDFGLALLAFAALMYWKWPPWLVVVASGVCGWLIGFAA